MHNESRAELQTEDDAPTLVSKTFSIHKAENDTNPQTATLTFVTTVALTEDEPDSYWRLTDRKALQNALDTGAVTESGVYFVAAMPDDDADDYRRESLSGSLLTITTTPRIQD